MFLTCSFEDSIRVLPKDLGQSTLEAVTAVLEKTYLDRVIKDVGLVVSIFDVLSIDGGFVYPSDGAVVFLVTFTLVVFRPLVEEVLIGKLKKCNKKGLWVSLTFFDDVFVPAHSLQSPSVFNEEEKLWLWEFDDNKMYMDIDEPVKLRVKDVKFRAVPTAAQLKQQGEEILGTSAQPFVPMEVVGGMDNDGLGCTAWWLPAAEEEGMED